MTAAENRSASPDDDDPHRDFALGQLLRHAHLQASAALLRAVRPLGLELRHVAALIELAAGPQTQRQLAFASEMDKATLVRVTDDLERSGLVVRRPHPVDRRSHLVSLTADGHHTLTRLREVARGTFAGLTAGMSQDRVELLVELLAEVAPAEPSSHT